MKKFKKTVAILLTAATLLISATSCTPELSPTLFPSSEPTPTPSEEPNVKTDLVLSDYVIIYPEEEEIEDYVIKNAAIDLSVAISCNTTSKCGIRSDLIDDDEKYTENVYEILIGKTNRVQSQNTCKAIENRFDFIIKQVDTKIVITGGCNDAIVNGVDYFIENYLSEELSTVTGMKKIDGLNYYHGSVFESDIVAWTMNGMDKLTSDNTYYKDEENAFYQINMAKNDTESMQIAMRALSNHDEDMTVVIEDDCDDIVGEAFLEYKTYAHEKKYVDALVPLSVNTFKMKKNTNEVALIRFKSNGSVSAGDYVYKVKLVDNKSGDTYITVTVNIHVWDFALPEAPSCTTAAGIDKSSLVKIYGSDVDIDELYKKYYDFLLDYKITAYDLPYDILDERADAYMSDARVTSFRVPYSNDDSVMIAYYNKLSTNEEWLKKAYFYPTDEPGSVDALNWSVYCAQRINRLCPGVKTNVPLHTLGDYDGKNAIDFFENDFNLWCLKSKLYENEEAERLNAMQVNGDELWWYVCWEPGDPYCNLLIDQLGIQHRLLFWQQAQYGATGFLYWSTTWWNSVDDPWEDISTVKWLSEYTYGDGSLLYNGNKVGVDGACPSMRLVMACDGIEDYELLMMAKSLFGEEWLQEKIATISTSLTEYTKKSNALETLRIEIAQEIEKELNK